MRSFYSEQARSLLSENHLDTFQALWQLQAPWFEPINQARKGWSGVCRLELNTVDKNCQAIFIKRQENFSYRTLMHPVRGLPTLKREYNNILNCKKKGIPTLTPLYYEDKKQAGQSQAVLITYALDQYQPMAEAISNWEQRPPALGRKRSLTRQLAHLSRQFHDTGLVHNCFYTKHIFIIKDWEILDLDHPPLHDKAPFILIDLEKARPKWLLKRRMVRDLYSLYATSASSPAISTTDAMRFFKSYLNTTKLCPRTKSLWRSIERYVLKKAKSRDPFKAKLRTRLNDQLG